MAITTTICCMPTTSH